VIRKLVKLDHENGGSFTEVDPIRVQREAMAVKHYLETAFDRKADTYQVFEQVMPLVLGALNGTLKLPYPFSKWPLKYVSSEGWLPLQFTSLMAGFKVAASALHLDEPQIELINGEEYAYMNFEEHGDYPDKVKYP
jgi:hypothetical protein